MVAKSHYTETNRPVVIPLKWISAHRVGKGRVERLLPLPGNVPRNDFNNGRNYVAIISSAPANSDGHVDSGSA